MKTHLAALAIGASLLTACASVEPEPCTSEWVSYKSDKILRSFAIDNRGLINDFRRMADADGNISPLAIITLLQKTKRIERFAQTFEDDVVPSLEAALSQCSQSDNLIPALPEFLRDEGVSGSVLDQIGPYLEAALAIRRDQQRNQDPI